MTTLKFSVAANPPRTITRVKQGDLPDDEVDFCSDTGPRTVVTGHGLVLGAGDTVKLELRPDKGEPIAVLDQLRDIQSSETEISFLNYVNSSSSRTVVQTKVPRSICGFCAANRAFMTHSVKFAALAPLTFGLIFGIMLTLSYWGHCTLKQKAR